jgi:hypothetical protein
VATARRADNRVLSLYEKEAGMGRRVGVLAVAVLLLGGAAASASPQGVVVELGSDATLVGAGEAATIDVTVSCPKKHDVLEAFVYITQDGFTSQFAGIGIRKCKGRPIDYTVTVRSLDQPFHAGDAFASAYVLVTTPSGDDTVSGGDTGPITIH